MITKLFQEGNSTNSVVNNVGSSQQLCLKFGVSTSKMGRLYKGDIQVEVMPKNSNQPIENAHQEKWKNKWAETET